MDTSLKDKTYISNILLILILSLLVIILISNIFFKKNEFLTNENVHMNDVPVNDISFDNELELTIPDKDMIYNPHGHRRPEPTLPYQHIDSHNLADRVDQNTVYVNTSGDTPLVYSLDRLDIDNNTPELLSPSIRPIDAGSGKIITTHTINNNVMDNMKSIE
jgi:hypothetical protein